jgi:hypothetical protein
MINTFDRNWLRLFSLSTRRHLIDMGSTMPLEYNGTIHPGLSSVGERIRSAKLTGASVILMMGAHVIRSGVQRFVIDLMKKGYISCVAMNGAGVIHDYELALVGATTESVADYIKTGEFGFWKETGHINDIVATAATVGHGLGEAVGRTIAQGDFPFCDASLLAAGYRLNIPITVHVGIGCDIVHQHPNCDGAAYGKTSYTDFLRFAHVLEGIENGVIMNFGSAVTAPEVYLKALSMVRNAAKTENAEIRHFTTLVCDLIQLPDDFNIEPDRSEPGYYFRPWKTMLVRTVSEGGKSFYVRGAHRQTIPQLWRATIDSL